MSVQPDRYAEGPESRDTIMEYDRGFEDLPGGQLNTLKPDLTYTGTIPKTGEFTEKGKTESAGYFNTPDAGPWVLLIGEKIE